MPDAWILKTEPGSYSFDDLVKEKRTRWDGVKNPVALKNIRAMKPGDPVGVYHTGSEKRLVGLARVASAPYPDPRHAGLTVVDLEPVKPLANPVALATIKADPAFKDLALVRQGRLSVVPVPAPLWARLLRLGGT
jgi:predicted RNA-binding protein with PUA-like domain